MKVELKDGRCRSCRGQLVIVHVDDLFMEVLCEDCNDSYHVQPDAFGDGAMVYFLDMMAARHDAAADGP